MFWQKKQKTEKVLKDLYIPLTVPSMAHKVYQEHYEKATHFSGRLFLFAGDQKIEHLNQDFYGPNIPAESASPKHLFDIASKARIGVFATQLGLIDRYGGDYRTINYLVKMNSKTNLISSEHADPVSHSLVTLGDVIEFKERTRLNIVGVGYTIYLGSVHEGQMLSQAARLIYDAHHYGFLVVLWMYPRGKSVRNEKDADVIAGAAGVGACLGADFVKVNPPQATTDHESAEKLQQATNAAGRTKVICSGGSLVDQRAFLQNLHHQIHVGGAQGAAIGRNIHQKTLLQATTFCKAAAAIIVDNASVEQAVLLLK